MMSGVSLVAVLAVSGVVALQNPPVVANGPAPLAGLGAVFRQQVIPNWNLSFCDVAGGNALAIRMRTSIGPDGNLIGAPTPLEPQDSSVWRVAAQSASDALHRAQPFQTPEGFQGATIVFVFDARVACPR